MTDLTFPPRLELYYSPKACSLASHIALEESGLAFVATAINIRTGDNRTAHYLQINPAGSVPSLAIGNQVLTESQAIMTYVADLVPERALLPRPGTLARARAHEWMNLASSSLHVAFRSIFRPQSYGGDTPAAQQAVRAQGHDNLERVLATIETRLGDQPYALGDAFSVVDAYLFVFYLWTFDERLERPMPSRPRYQALARHVWQRPAVRTVVARERAVRAFELPQEMATVPATAA